MAFFGLLNRSIPNAWTASELGLGHASRARRSRVSDYADHPALKRVSLSLKALQFSKFAPPLTKRLSLLRAGYAHLEVFPARQGTVGELRCYEGNAAFRRERGGHADLGLEDGLTVDLDDGVTVG